jgi:hypothetical protein
LVTNAALARNLFAKSLEVHVGYGWMIKNVVVVAGAIHISNPYISTTIFLLVLYPFVLVKAKVLHGFFIHFSFRLVIIIFEIVVGFTTVISKIIDCRFQICFCAIPEVMQSVSVTAHDKTNSILEL